MAKAGFNPAQSRDYWGKWGTGGGPSGARPLGHPTQPPPPQIVQQPGDKLAPEARGPGDKKRKLTSLDVFHGTQPVGHFLRSPPVERVIGGIWSTLNLNPKLAKVATDLVWVALRDYLLGLMDGLPAGGFLGWPSLTDVYNQLDQDPKETKDELEVMRIVFDKAYQDVEKLATTKEFTFWRVDKKGKRTPFKHTIAKELGILAKEFDGKELLDAVKKANPRDVLWPSFQESKKSALAQQLASCLKAGFQPSQARDCRNP